MRLLCRRRSRLGRPCHLGILPTRCTARHHRGRPAIWPPRSPAFRNRIAFNAVRCEISRDAEDAGRCISGAPPVSTCGKRRVKAGCIFRRKILKVHPSPCHCGGVKFRVTAEIVELTTCDCSRCVKKNAVMTKVPEASLQIIEGANMICKPAWNGRGHAPLPADPSPPGRCYHRRRSDRVVCNAMRASGCGPHRRNERSSKCRLSGIGWK